METACALTKEYLGTRKQFGRPIGTFQALAHRMADLLIEMEQARSAVILAAGNLEADRGTRERHDISDQKPDRSCGPFGG